MIASAWKSQGAGSIGRSTTYGLRVGSDNRDRYFDRSWTMVTIELPSGMVLDLPLHFGFWRGCPEVKGPGFREWFETQGLLTWPYGQPPRYRLTPTGRARFKVTFINVGE